MVGLTIGMMIYNRSKNDQSARNISIKLSQKTSLLYRKIIKALR